MPPKKRLIRLDTPPEPTLQIKRLPMASPPPKEKVYGQLELYDAGKLVKALEVDINTYKLSTDGSGAVMVQCWHSGVWLSIHGGLKIAVGAGSEKALQEYDRKDVLYQ